MTSNAWIVLIVTSYCSDFRSVLACWTLCWGHSWPIGHNKSHSMVSYPVSSCFCSVFCRVPYWGCCCYTFCTMLSLNSWSCHGLQIHQYADDSQVYMSVSVSEVQTAVHSFAVCVHDVNKWMRASRLQLNPTKTQVMWLGSSQQLKHVDINNILLLSTTIQVVESTRDLGVMLDSCWHYQRMSQCSVGLVTTSSDNFAHSSNWGRWRLQEPQLRHYFLSVGLLQFAALQAAGQTTAQDAVCAEYYCMTDHWHTMQWPHLATSIT